jgi:hypothetical protein
MNSVVEATSCNKTWNQFNIVFFLHPSLQIIS